MENAENPFLVYTYQIPVPLGDCSVHLLVKGDDVDSAIIMDGGTNAKGLRASGQITKFLDVIRARHPDPMGWKFNAWVVTHWDADHHYGMLECMRSEEFVARTFAEPRRIYCGASIPAKQTGVRHPLKGEYYWKFLRDCGFPDQNNIFDRTLIGMDLFTGKQVFKDLVVMGTARPVKDLEFSNTVNLDLSRPRFCVLGAGGYGIGQTKSFVLKGKPTPNQTSILAMLFWPKSKKCSYYTGGDGFPAVEGISICGLLNHKKLMQGPVHVIKLDHHGSSRELLPPLESPGENSGPSVNRPHGNIVAGFMPKKIIVTPGKRYGHPSWSVILFLQDYFKNHNRGKALYTTRFPYWMTEKPRRSDINVKKFNDIKALLDEVTEIARLSEEDLRPYVLGEEDFPDTDDDEDFDVQDVLLEEGDDIMETETERMADEKKEKKEFFQKEIREYLEGERGLRWIPKNVMRKIGNKYKKFKEDEYEKMEAKLKISYLNATKVEPAVNKDFLYDLIPQEDRSIIATVCEFLWERVSAQQPKEDDPLWPHYLLRVTSNPDENKDDVVEFLDSELGPWKS